MATPISSLESAIDCALGGAATARLARLVTRDSIFAAPRLRYVRAMDSLGHAKLAELAACPWRIAVWIGAAVAVAIRVRVRGYRVVTCALAFSLAAGVIGELGIKGDHG